MKRIAVFITAFVLALLVLPVTPVLADHEWFITGVTCDPGSQTITIYGISSIDTSNDTAVYIDGVYLDYFSDADFTDGPVSFNVSNPGFTDGAVILVENPSTATSATTVCQPGSADSPQWFDPGDDRINRQAYAPIAVYCTETGMEVLAINSDGKGTPAISIATSALPSAEAGNVLIQSAGNIQLYGLSSGEYLARVGPDAEGKFYRLVWDGCPQTYVVASTELNGVITPSETISR